MWVLFLAAAQSPFGFTSIHRDVTAPTWEVREGEVCSGFDINAVIHPQAEVTSNQCFAKCAADPTIAGCGGFIAAQDDALSNSLCVDVATCKDICWRLDECIGIDQHNTLDRCYLNLWECAGRIAEGTLAEDAAYSIHIKQVPWQGECPLGLYVMVDGGRSDVDGTFRQVEGDSTSYVRTDETVRVHWDGCQWDVQHTAGPAPAPAPAAAACVDDHDAVNFLFGRVNATYDDDLCSMGENAGYCASAVFAGVCSATCKVSTDACNGDNVDAANHLADLWQVDPVGCGICFIPTDGPDDTDPVVEELCKDTCPDVRRLEEQRAHVFARTHAKSFGLFDYDSVAHSARRLTAHGDWEDYFWSQYGAVAWKQPCTEKSPDVSLLNDNSFCDVQKFEAPVHGLNMSAKCPDRDVYLTTTGAYCPLKHAALPASTAAERCYTKCAGGQRGTHCEGFDPLFLHDSQALCLPRELCEEHCSATAGCASIDMHRSLPRCYLNTACNSAHQNTTDPSYNLLEKEQARIQYRTQSDVYCHHDTGAVPLEAMGDHKDEACLAKCDPFGPACKDPVMCDGAKVQGTGGTEVNVGEQPSLQDCANHVHYNHPDANGATWDSSNKTCYAEKGQTGVSAPSDKYENCRVDQGMNPSCFCDGVVGLDASSASDRSALCLPREKCEEVCTGIESCAGFDMHQTLPRCYLNSATADCSTSYVSDESFEMVSKIPARPCYPVLDYFAADAAPHAMDHAYLEGFPGEYSTIVDGEYLMGDKKIKWDGCWKVESAGSWRFSSAAMALGTDGCTATTQAGHVLTTGYAVEELYFAFCPNRPGMHMERVCEGIGSCPVLTRCVVTEARMEQELLAQRPQGRAARFVGSLGCAAHAADPTKLVAKQLASPTRAEYLINVGKYGPHFQSHLVYRDEPRAPQVEFEHVSGDIVSIVLAKASHGMSSILETEMGFPGYHLPQGYSGFVSDVIRIEAFDLPHGDGAEEICTDAAERKFIFVVHSDAAQIAVMQDGQLGLTDVEKLEDGRFRVTVSLPAGRVSDFVAIADIDECAENPCGANQRCVNAIGYVTCECEAGLEHYVHDGCTDSPTYSDMWGYPCADWASDCRAAQPVKDCAGVGPDPAGVACEVGGWYDSSGYFYTADHLAGLRANCPVACNTCRGWTVGSGDEAVREDGLCPECSPGCHKEEFVCPPIKVRVSNAEALGLGWRLREIKLFSDEQCTEDIGAQITELKGDLSEYKSLPGACVGSEIVAYSHQIEAVRAMQCHTKCGSGTYQGARKLTPKRRLQLFPDDWANCDGYKASAHGSSSVNDLCASPATCETLCDRLGDECTAFHIASSGRCVLYSSCSHESKEQADGTVMFKASTFKATSSHDGAHGVGHSWVPHPAALVIDGYGATGGFSGADDYLNTEWWSQCYECGANEGFVELLVTLPAGVPCHVHSAAVFQDPEFPSATLNFAAGAGDTVVGTRPDDRRKLAAVGPTYYGSWQHEQSSQSCYPLTCGGPGMYSGATLRSVEGVDSPCLCKQLCLETEGCEVYNLYKEEDNVWAKEMGEQYPDWHVHSVCYLIGSGWTYVDVATQHWISGTTGTVLSAFAKDGDTVTVSGYHLSDANARLKIVHWTEDADNCADDLADTVDGIGCSDRFICSPKPATTGRSSASWTGISVAAGSEDMKYRVCYCSGPCYAAWQYSSVGSKPLEVEGVGFAWTLKEAKVGGAELGCSASRVANVSLVVDRPAFHSLSDSSDWELKLVTAGETCEGAHWAGVMGVNLTVEADKVDFWLHEENTTAASRYVVCFREGKDEDFYEIDGRTAECGRFLEFDFTAKDLEAPIGFYTNQRFSGSAGVTVQLSVAGNLVGFAPNETSHSLSVGKEDCSEEWARGKLGNATYVSQTEAAAEYSFDASELTKGTYKVCATTPQGVGAAATEIGELTLTEHAEVGWTYVLDPTVAGSIEITGAGLDWKFDRIMLVDCEATCGISAPADVDVEGARQTLLGANTFIAQNSHFDQAAAAAAGAADLPSELRTYTTVAKTFCRGHNMVPAGAAEHQCHRKCAGTADAGCGGFLPEQDAAENEALCLSEEQCRSLCTMTPDCVGIDMSNGLDRCFLNGPADAGGCDEQFEDGSLGFDADHSYLHRVGSYTGRRATADGFSSDALLRFSPVSFQQGGSYKVCFCDHDLLPEGQTHCLAEADYSVEIGKVYASGVSCLLSDEKFRRGTCFEQFHGGLSCGVPQTGQNQARAEPMSLPPSAGLPSAYASH